MQDKNFATPQYLPFSPKRLPLRNNYNRTRIFFLISLSSRQTHKIPVSSQVKVVFVYKTEWRRYNDDVTVSDLMVREFCMIDKNRIKFTQEFFAQNYGIWFCSSGDRDFELPSMNFH